MDFSAWNGFKPGTWQNEINVSDFIKQNYTPYLGDGSFLEGATQRTLLLNEKLQKLLDKERKNNGVLDVNAEVVSSLTSYEPGYLDKENEIIVGIQTDQPLKRGVNPFGGMRMVKS